MKPLSVGELVRLLREHKGIAQQTVAQELQVHTNTVGNWERGTHEIPADRRRQLEALLGLTEGYLDDYEDPLTPLRALQEDVARIRQSTDEILSLLRSKKRSAS